MRDPIDPPRYLESGLPEGKLLELLGAPPMTDAQIARGEERITKLASSPPKAAGISSLLKVVALLAVGAVPVLIVVRSDSESARAKTPVHVDMPPATTAAPPAKPIDAPPTLHVESLPSVTATPPRVVEARSAAPPAAPNDRLARELALLDHARERLATDPAAALRDVNRHATEFSDGQLVAEREVIAVDALRRLGRIEEARARGNAFVDRAPGSAAARRIESLLNGSPSPLSR